MKLGLGLVTQAAIRRCRVKIATLFGWGRSYGSSWGKKG